MKYPYIKQETEELYKNQCLYQSLFPAVKEEFDYYIANDTNNSQQDLLLTSGYFPNHNSNPIMPSTPANMMIYQQLNYDLDYNTSNNNLCDMSYLPSLASPSCSQYSTSNESSGNYSPPESFATFDIYSYKQKQQNQQHQLDRDIITFNNTVSVDFNPIMMEDPLLLLPHSSTSSSSSSSSSSISYASSPIAAPVTTAKQPSQDSDSASSRPYPCHLCRRAFARKHDLQRHIRVHTGDKPYACPCCKKAFARTDALKRHLRMEDQCRASQEVQAMKETGKRRYRNL